MVFYLPGDKNKYIDKYAWRFVSKSQFCSSSSPLLLLEIRCSIRRQNRNMLQYQKTNSVLMNKSELPNHRKRMQTLTRRQATCCDCHFQSAIHLESVGSILVTHRGEPIYLSHDLGSNPRITFTYTVPESHTTHLEY